MTAPAATSDAVRTGELPFWRRLRGRSERREACEARRGDGPDHALLGHAHGCGRRFLSFGGALLPAVWSVLTFKSKFAAREARKQREVRAQTQPASVKAYLSEKGPAT